MNAGLADSHPSIRFYDSDYPGKETTTIPANFDETTALQEEPSLRSRVTIERQDITRLELDARFSLATLAFNSLLCIVERARLEIVSMEGGHQHEPFTENSPKIFIVARRARF